MGKKSKEKKNTFKSVSSGNKKKKKKSGPSGKRVAFRFKVNERVRRIAGLTLVVFALLLLLSFISHLFAWKSDYSYIYLSAVDFLSNDQIRPANIAGKLGATLSHILITRGFGIASFVLVLVLPVTGLRWLAGIRLLPQGKLYRHCSFLLVFVSVAAGYIFRSEDLLLMGGSVGYHSRNWLISMLGDVGTGLILLFILGVYALTSFNFLLRILKKKEENQREKEPRAEEQTAEIPQNREKQPEKTDNQSHEEDIKEEDIAEGDIINKGPEVEAPDTTDTPPEETGQELSTRMDKDPGEEEQPDDLELTVEQAKTEEAANGNQEHKGQEHYKIDTPYDPTLELRDYQLPGTDLLDVHGSDMISVEKEELEANKNKILKTLHNYNIEISRIKATIGPTITLYEIVPAPGVRISKIKNLEDDIALSLSALGIRIIAPIPGRGTIGIEVPNSNPEIVSMKTVIRSNRFQSSRFDLPVAIGKTISNETFVFDLAKMPHLLMAGATGQGKSVGLNAIIASLLYKKHPSQLKFVMVDPKKVELSLFSKIERHYLAKLPDSEEAIITDTQKVVKTLSSLTVEMDQRYELLKNAQVRNIKEYNTKFVDRKLNPENGHRYLPYIVLIVDEFADLIMTAGKEVESPIARLAQLARAVGIHLIIATQRPSVNIITGVIKANFPARIAFRVTSKVDSRTILDASGADQLIGRGDMLLSTGNDLLRLQCAFLDTPEVDSICNFIGSQRAYPSAFLLPEVADEPGSDNAAFDDEDKDELFEDAARVIVMHQHGSTSLLQRKLKLGYNRAGRIIDQLEAAGIVGPFEGSKAREVKITDEASLEQFLNDHNNNP